MFCILINLACFGLNVFISKGDMLTINGPIGLLNLFAAGFILGIRE